MVKTFKEVIVNEPKYSINDIVYLYGGGKSPSKEWPVLNSPFCIDCKIINSPVRLSSERLIGFHKYDYYYTLITGNGVYLREIYEGNLVKAQDRQKYTALPILFLKEDTELAPKGSVFQKEGEYWNNTSNGVSIHSSRMEKLNHLFRNLNEEDT